MEATHTPEEGHQAVVAKVGRNDPCPCGSGNKFKKCCIDSPAYNPAPVQAPSTAKAVAAQPAAPGQSFAKHGQARGAHAMPANRNTFIRRKV